MLDFIEWGYDFFSWPGIVIFMAIENALPAAPIPSELIMPFAGWFLIEDEGLSPAWLLLAGFLGAVGSLIGSLFVYGVSAWLGRPLLERYGRYFFITHADLQRGEELFEERGDVIVLVARVLPLVRTLVSIPAGIARMPILRFSLFTFVGSFFWSLALASGGYILGENYEDLREWMRPADVPIVIALVLGIGWYVYQHARRRGRRTARQSEAT
ncbi:MAG: DedA family protein [Dehalococcoidia bacterium]|nr:DedA family protein [Dehalococcoidia bacterium]